MVRAELRLGPGPGPGLGFGRRAWARAGLRGLAPHKHVVHARGGSDATLRGQAVPQGGNLRGLRLMGGSGGGMKGWGGMVPRSFWRGKGWGADGSAQGTHKVEH